MTKNLPITFHISAIIHHTVFINGTHVIILNFFTDKNESFQQVNVITFGWLHQLCPKYPK